jgi:hypothetical protein
MPLSGDGGNVVVVVVVVNEVVVESVGTVSAAEVSTGASVVKAAVVPVGSSWRPREGFPGLDAEPEFD